MTKAELERDLETARGLARLYYHWALWHDAVMAEAFCARSEDELRTLDARTADEYEQWRHVRESGLRHANPWIIVPPEQEEA